MQFLMGLKHFLLLLFLCVMSGLFALNQFMVGRLHQCSVLVFFALQFFFQCIEVFLVTCNHHGPFTVQLFHFVGMVTFVFLLVQLPLSEVFVGLCVGLKFPVVQCSRVFLDQHGVLVFTCQGLCFEFFYLLLQFKCDGGVFFLWHGRQQCGSVLLLQQRHVLLVFLFQVFRLIQVFMDAVLVLLFNLVFFIVTGFMCNLIMVSFFLHVCQRLFDRCQFTVDLSFKRGLLHHHCSAMHLFLQLYGMVV